MYLLFLSYFLSHLFLLALLRLPVVLAVKTINPTVTHVSWFGIPTCMLQQSCSCQGTGSMVGIANSIGVRHIHVHCVSQVQKESAWIESTPVLLQTTSDKDSCRIRGSQPFLGEHTWILKLKKRSSSRLGT